MLPTNKNGQQRFIKFSINTLIFIKIQTTVLHKYLFEKFLTKIWNIFCQTVRKLIDFYNKNNEYIKEGIQTRYIKT